MYIEYKICIYRYYLKKIINIMFFVSSTILNYFQIFLFIKFYLLNYLLIIYLFIKELNR